MANNNEFSGEIRVASRIIDYLSSGLYESPSACLKELINNSYDADAKIVNVYVKPDADRIIIDDNGNGMNRVDFVKHFSLISESHKREESNYTESGRPKIGKIGIGFIAANEICDVMEIVSTKKGSSELLEVKIQFDKMRQDPYARRRENTELAKADYLGKVSETDLESHFTQIFLKQIRGDAKDILAGAGTSQFSAGKESIYGLKKETVLNKLKNKNLKTWSEFDAYSKNLLEVGLNVPIQYHEGWLPEYLLKDVTDIEKHVENLNFSLFIDGSEIRKPIVLNPTNKSIIRKFEFNGDFVAAKGYFYAQHGSIHPQELQGILIRIRNAAVGKYDRSFLGFKSSIGTVIQNWISAEIMADDRLEDAMNIDRHTLRVAHPAYVELQREVHKFLDTFIKEVRRDIYGSGSEVRNLEKANKVKEKILILASREIEEFSPTTANDIKRAWSDTITNRNDQNKLLRKFSIDQLYEIVIEIAKDVLSEEQFNEFLSRLTERLQQ